LALASLTKKQRLSKEVWEAIFRVTDKQKCENYTSHNSIHHTTIHLTKGGEVVTIHHITTHPITTHHTTIHHIIKGPDNPTSQFLPIIGKSGCSGTEKEEKTKEMAEGQSL
jgi:hypothetical protein